MERKDPYSRIIIRISTGIITKSPVVVVVIVVVVVSVVVVAVVAIVVIAAVVQHL